MKVTSLMSRILLSPFSRWILLTGISYVSLMTGFSWYKHLNPRTYGFMGDETPYGLEGFLVFFMLLGFCLLNLSLVAVWSRKSREKQIQFGLQIGFLELVLPGLLAFGSLISLFTPFWIEL